MTAVSIPLIYWQEIEYPNNQSVILCGTQISVKYHDIMPARGRHDKLGITRWYFESTKVVLQHCSYLNQEHI